jgi:hypothetical protein
MRRLKSLNTLGQNRKFFLGASTAYSDSATYGDFITEALVGEIGVFLVGASGSEFAATLRTTALTGVETVIVAERLGDKLGERQFRKTTIEAGSIKRSKLSDFAAPISQVSIAGHDLGATAGDLIIEAPFKDVEYSLKIQDLTYRNEPYPTFYFNYVANNSDTEETVIDALIAKINEAYSGGGYPVSGQREEPIKVQAVKVNGAGSELGIKFTGDSQIIFNVQFNDGLEGSPVNYNNTGIYVGGQAVGFAEGSGYKEWMANAEYEGDVFEGATTQNDRFAENYGLPSSLAVTNLGYDLIYLDVQNDVASKAIPNDIQHECVNLAIAAPAKVDAAAIPDYDNILAQVSPIDQLKTIFGL